MTKTPDLTTLHAALDIYAEQIGKQAGHTSAASLSNRQTIVALLKRYHDDIPLHAIDLTACVAMIDLWKHRPVNQRTGKPYAASTAAKALAELIRFFWWLDMSDQFAWKSPSHFGQISRRVVSVPSDRRPFHREEFTIEQLAILYRHATPTQRLTLCLAMNCGMGVAEMARLGRSNFICDEGGGFVIDLMPDEGILRFVRPKTGVFGEWLLWSETVEAARWAIVRSEELGSDLLFVTDGGATAGRA